MVQCEVVWLDHAHVVQSQRTILKTQLAAAAERGGCSAGRFRLLVASM
jgi:glutamine synthetase